MKQMSLVKILCAFNFKYDVTCFLFKDILLRGRILQRAEKVTSDFVQDHHKYNDARALYSCISNNLRHLDQVNRVEPLLSGQMTGCRWPDNKKSRIIKDNLKTTC